ncbi:hypothetical protein Q9R19_09795 [Microbacterium sp. ARD32]|uniref:hypothetical protein n=1 Tax=Microbacterium sp. ARD32 TaxID=2962577 RepID=UPI0028810306|nr:hypothetical protein [Microbacterium sp. ARD32]MDT0157915.1 hypothetical protein [Microbacterium sp. ARD32]
MTLRFTDGPRAGADAHGERAPRRGTTRMHLRIAAFAAVQVLPVIALSPVMPQLAAWSPPVYALLAGLQTLFVFTARRMVPLRWAATLAALITAVLVGPFNAIGWLIAVPLVTAGGAFDLMMWLSERSAAPRWLRHAVIGCVVGVALFAVSLPVMSAEHLLPGLLVATLLARVAASTAGSWLSARIVAALHRAGVR